MGNYNFDEYKTKEDLNFADAVDGLDSHYNKQLSKLTTYIRNKKLTNFIVIATLFDNYYTLYKNNLDLLYEIYDQNYKTTDSFNFYNCKLLQIKDKNQQLLLDTTENYFIDLAK